jgi:hypothetical protein
MNLQLIKFSFESEHFSTDMNLAVSAQGYGDEITFDFRAGKTGYSVIKPADGIEFLELLAAFSNKNHQILNMKIFSHSYPRGIIMTNWSGFYYSPGPNDTNRAAYLIDLAEFIEKGNISFAPNSQIVMFGCNLANGDFSRKLSEITGGTVIASYAGVSPEIKANKETGVFISAGRWVKYYNGQVAVYDMGKRIRAW